ncbi:MAG: 50S ribosomal protein L25 [Solirubrobacteraceae bacterium]
MDAEDHSGALPLPFLLAMADDHTTSLEAQRREVSNSRETRRLRRAGLVPGVVYGGGDEPVAFQVEARRLRQALAHAGAVLDLSLDGAGTTPVVVKDEQHDVVRGGIVHLDLMRVRLDQAIQATVALELVGAENAPGVTEGGVLEHVTREITVEALPTELPDSITFDVSAMQINDTVTLEAVTAPAGVTLLDDLQETVVVTLTPPRLQDEEETEVEEETELVGEQAAAAAAAEESGGTEQEAEQRGEGGGG